MEDLESIQKKESKIIQKTDKYSPMEPIKFEYNYQGRILNY